MSEEKKYYYLQLHKDFFKRHDIQIIEDMPNGKEYVLFYLKLMAESISHEGSLRFNEAIPYSEQMLATITRTHIDTVRCALETFVGLGMVTIHDDATIYMNEVNKMLGSSNNKSTQRVQKFREKKLLMTERDIPFIETHINNKRYGGNYYKVIERDNYCCKECGSESTLMVHHVVPYDSDDDETVRIENLVLLCSKCHTSLHNKSENKKIGLLPKQEILVSIGFDETLQKRYETFRKRYIELELKKESEKELDSEKEKEVPCTTAAAWLADAKNLECVKLYEKNIGKATEVICEQFNNYISMGFEDAMICEVIKEAVMLNKANMKYIDGIMMGCENDHAFTWNDYKRRQVTYSMQKGW